MAVLTKNIAQPINQLSNTEKRWFAVYTKFKCEKYVAEHLQKKQIDAYVPLISKTKRYNKKIKKYEIPLINCYVFVSLTSDKYVATLETEYVLKFLRQGKDLLAIPDHEIDVLRRITGQIIEVNAIENSVMTVGSEVEVLSGNLAGIKGRIVAKADKKSFVVELINIGFQFRIEIDYELLMPIKSTNKLHHN